MARKPRPHVPDGLYHVVARGNRRQPIFTEDADHMRLVLERLHQRHLFFLDSVTTPKSTARAAAQAAGVPYLARKVFLDDSVEDAAIHQRLDDLITVAKRDGQAIAIGHPHAETIAALQGFEEQAKQQGVEIVSISALLEK